MLALLPPMLQRYLVGKRDKQDPPDWARLHRKHTSHEEALSHTGGEACRGEHEPMHEKYASSIATANLYNSTAFMKLHRKGFLCSPVVCLLFSRLAGGMCWGCR